MNRKALGKGLGALIPGVGTFGARTIQEVEIGRIRENPLQPRKEFTEEGLAELTQSILNYGILQPLLVRRINEEEFELIAGERRLRAARRAGLKTVPVIVEEAEESKKLELALVENLQREDLNPIEMAEGLQKLIDDFGLTHEEVAQRVGKNRSTISNLLRLLSLPEPIKEKVRRGEISVGHAKALLGLENEKEQLELTKDIVEKSLSVREVEKKVKELSKKRIASPVKFRGVISFVEEEKNVEELLTRFLGARVQVGGGKIVIHYHSEEELRRLYSLITESHVK